MQTLDSKPKVSKYLHLRNSLVEAMEQGKYEKGSRLPPQMDLAKQYNVSLITVRQALDLLEKEGRISQEHGRGTFVRDTQPGDAAQKGKRSIAFVLAEESYEKYSFKIDPKYSFTSGMIGALTRFLEERDQFLTVSGLNSYDILDGKLPAALQHVSVAGVILSHFVEDIHVQFLKRQGIPVVVLGNYPLRSRVANVCVNIHQVGYLMSKALLSRGKGPLYIMTEPFRLHYTQELYAGYARACREMGCRESLCTVEDNDRVAGDELRRIIGENKGPFSLLIHCNVAHILMEVYKEYRLDLRDYPVAIFGAADYAPPEVRRQLNQCVIDTRCTGRVALELLEKVIAGEKIEKVILEPELTTSEEDGLFHMELGWK